MTKEALSAEQIRAAKGEGFLLNRGTRRFSCRIMTTDGFLRADQLRVLAEAAEKYGNGSIAFTIRMNIEVPGIEYENIQAFKDLIATAGLRGGGTGARVRTVVACKGSTCVYGLCDTRQIAAEIYARFYEGYYDVSLPGKFKIGAGGCPNNCAKPDTNDFALVGQRIHKLNRGACRGCAKCGIVAECPMKAASLRDGKIDIDYSLCNNCGRCVTKCHFDVVEGYEDRFKVYVGGMWGRTPRRGVPLDSYFTKDELYEVIEKSVLLYKDKGLPGERFGHLCERSGMGEINRLLAPDAKKE